MGGGGTIPKPVAGGDDCTHRHRPGGDGAPPSRGMTFLTHLECSKTGARLPADRPQNLSPAGWPLLARYDLDAVRRSVSPADLTARPANLWRYRELLPVAAEHVTSLGEVMTPLVRLASADGELLVKDESHLPTGSFKARGLAVAVSMARGFGIRRAAMPSNGNAGAALAAYCARAGIEAYVFCPSDTPPINLAEIARLGARLTCVDGLINDCGKLVAAGVSAHGWFDVSTLKEPYRIEGKKTMGFELAEQLGWKLPDVILYPTGGGTGLIGMWKAFAELEAIGWIGPERPRMVAVQASGCAPIVRAFDAGAEHAELWQNAHTVAAGIRVPGAIGDFLMLRALRESGGFAIAVDDDAIIAARNAVAANEGLLMCPEGAATYAAYQRALGDGRITRSERVVLFNCATGLKYL